jgi:hypothetical protein
MPRLVRTYSRLPNLESLSNPEPSSNMARPGVSDQERDRATSLESEQSDIAPAEHGDTEDLDQPGPSEYNRAEEQRAHDRATAPSLKGKAPVKPARPRYSIIPDEPIDGIEVVDIETLEDFMHHIKVNPLGMHVAVNGALKNRFDYKREALQSRPLIQDLKCQVRDLITERDEFQQELLAALRKLNAQPLAAAVPSVARETPSKTAKLPDPEKYNGPSIEKDKDGVDLEDWLAKVRRKLRANQDHYYNEELRMGYVQNMVGGMAAKHLAPRLRVGTTSPFQNAEEMLTTLENAYGNPHKKQDAADAFRRLYQNSSTFHTFWAEFQRLAAETEMPESTQLEELGYRVSAELQHALLAVDNVHTVYELAQRCMVMDAKIQRLKKVKARGSSKATATAGGSSPSAAASGGSGAPVTVKDENRTQGSGPSLTRTRPTYDNAEKQQLSREGKCFYCKGLGHLARECPNKASRINEVGGGTAAASALQAPSNPPSSSHSEN